MQIQIVAVSVETKPTAKGSYQQAEVTYKNLAYPGKVDSKKIMSFGANAPAFKVLVEAKAGETFTVTVVKNDKGYNDWTAVTRGIAENPVSTTTSPAPSAGYAKAASSTKSTYETPEERAIKQVYIVRQSSISAAVASLSIGSKVALKPSDVIAAAKEYEAFVFSSGNVGDGEDTSGFEDMTDDVPY